MSLPQQIDLAFALFAEAKLDDVRVTLDAVLAVDPNQAEALQLLGSTLFQQGKVNEALAAVRRAIDVEPDAGDLRFNLGQMLRAAGRVEEATDAYRLAVEREALNAQYAHALATALQQLGNVRDAVDWLERAVEINPNDAVVLNDLGVVYRKVHRAEAAAIILRRSVEFFEKSADAKAPAEVYENLISALIDSREVAEATAIARREIVAYPAHAMAHVMLSNALQASGQNEDALIACRDAVRLDAECAAAHYSIGVALHAMGELHGARLALTECDRLRPNFSAVKLQLGLVLAALGDLKSSIDLYRAILEHEPDYHAARHNLCAALEASGNVTDAIAETRLLVERLPRSASSNNMLAVFLSKIGAYSESETYFKRAVELMPNDPTILGNFGMMYASSGRVVDCVELLRKSRDLRRDDATAYSNLLLYLNAHPEMSAQAVFEDHRDYGVRFGRPLTAAAAPHAPGDPLKKKLRIGYVSPDFHFHSVSYFMEPILSAHDRDSVEVYIYDNTLVPDAMTFHLRNFADQWFRVAALNDEHLAAKIRADQIDVLVELAGHTANHRLRVMAMRPAPVQVAYLGYPNTTGVEAIDYRIADRVTDPPGESEHRAVERIVRPAKTFLTYRASGDAPDVAALPALANGYTTFCSFNAIWKLNDPLIELWSAVLRRLPTARMLIKSTGLDDAGTSGRLLAGFERFGIPRDRLELLTRAPSYAGHLGTYNRCDVQLDSYPYNGTTTLCEGFWMGVPVVTLCGNGHPSRVGASLNHCLGLDELTAHSREAFVDIAVALGSDVERMATLRNGMRARMARTTLQDAPRFTRKLEREYRAMWRIWCKRSREANVSSPAN